MWTPRAFERLEHSDEDGTTWSVLVAVDEHGEIELDRWPEEGAGAEAAHLNAHPDELRRDIHHARTHTGPWAPRS